MGFLKTGTTTNDFKVYLTDEGRKKLLEQGYVPTHFVLTDSEILYEGNLNLYRIVGDLTGDHDDNVYSLSKNITIKELIIK